MATGFAYIPATQDGLTVVADNTPEWGDEYPDGYGGFGAPHCDCGELIANCGCDPENMTQFWTKNAEALAITHCDVCGSDTNAWMSCLCALPF